MMLGPNPSWQQVPIKHVWLEFHDGPHATPKPSESGPIYLGIKNISEDGHLDLSDIRHVAEEDYPNWIKRVEPRPGDIVFTYEATLNRYAIIPEGFRGCLGRRLALIRPNPDRVDRRFLFYYFFGREWRATIQSKIIQGSTVDRIPIITFPDFKISLPSLPTQRKIAAFLSAYDDLIENNTRRIQILEEMAQTIYREWFVNFRFPGHENVEMVETQLGLVPADWNTRKLRDIATLHRDGVVPSDHGEEVFHHYSIPAFDANREPGAEYGHTIRSNKYLVRPDCVLLSKLNPRIPRVWLPFLANCHRSIASTEFLVLTANPGLNRYFLYGLCSLPEFLDRFSSMALGTSTSHQRVKPEDLLDMVLLLSTLRIVKDYATTVEPMLVLSNALRLSNVNLRRTRDLLLPKLLSGEVDVDG